VTLFQKTFLILFLGLLSAQASKIDLFGRISDSQRVVIYKEECQRVSDWVINGRYKVDCFDNYHHYNSRSRKFYNREKLASQVKVGSFNLWNPGAKSTSFKDYSFLAKLINKFDLVAGLELLPSVGKDYAHNSRVRKFIEKGDLLLEKARETYERNPSSENWNHLNKLESHLERAPKLYRAPGYVQLLHELRKIDAGWSLILAPSGEAADENYVHEFSGFYYRAKNVLPKINEHCREFEGKRGGSPYACYPNLNEEFMGRSVRDVFSRRPFIGSFKSGSFDFSLIASHVIFNSPDSDGAMESILYPSFGISHYRELQGAGVTKTNYARLAEMKVIMEFMQRLRGRYKEKDIIYVGDTNLESKNPFWSRLFKNNLPNDSLFIEDATTVSVRRYRSNGTPTRGESNDFDHVILSKSHSKECLKKYKPRRHKFYRGSFQAAFKAKYIVRSSNGFLSSEGRKKMLKLIKDKKAKLSSVETIKWNKIVKDKAGLDSSIDAFKQRVFMGQLEDSSYYRVYKEILSDHFPISFQCQTNKNDDD
jgi:hypothetical protein